MSSSPTLGTVYRLCPMAPEGEKALADAEPCERGRGKAPPVADGLFRRAYHRVPIRRWNCRWER